MFACHPESLVYFPCVTWPLIRSATDVRGSERRGFAATVRSGSQIRTKGPPASAGSLITHTKASGVSPSSLLLLAQHGSGPRKALCVSQCEGWRRIESGGFLYLLNCIMENKNNNKIYLLIKEMCFGVEVNKQIKKKNQSEGWLPIRQVELLLHNCVTS